jgi:hypothetical protein
MRLEHGRFMTRSPGAAVFMVLMNRLALATGLDRAFTAGLFVIGLARTTIVVAIGSTLPPDRRLVVSVTIAPVFGVAIVLTTALLTAALLATALRPIIVGFAATPIRTWILFGFQVVAAATRLRSLFHLGSKIRRPLIVLVGRPND